MKTLALLVIHFLTTLAQRVGPGGAKAIIAESVLLKHQQLIARRPGNDKSYLADERQPRKYPEAHA